MPKFRETTTKRSSRLHKRYLVTIPEHYIRFLEWKKGEELLLTMDQDSIIIENVEDVENTNLHHDNEEVNGFQGNESEIEKHYMEHPDAIENGLQIIENQRSTSAGYC